MNSSTTHFGSLNSGWLALAWEDRLRHWLAAAATSLPTLATSTAVSIEDQADIQAAQGGDGQAFARLVERYQNQVGQAMWRFTRDRGQWETLVQDVMVDAYLSLSSYRGRGPFGAWLRTIATRTGYKFWKQRDRAREVEQFSIAEWDAAAEDDAIEASDAAELIHRALAQLPPRDRLVLTLMYLEGCTVAETAERTGWSRAMVKVQAHRARGKLKLLLEAEGES